MTDASSDTAPQSPLSHGVTREDVRHVAALASLELTAAEEVSMERDLNAILGYVAELNELDTSSIAPMSQVSEILAAHGPRDEVGGGSSPSALRADEPRPSLPRPIVMRQAPATDGSFFKVPKVIER